MGSPLPSWASGLAAVGEATATLDGAGRIVALDAAMERLGGLDAGAAVGRAFEEVFPVADGRVTIAGTDDGEEPRTYETILTPRDREAGWSVTLRRIATGDAGSPEATLRAQEARYRTVVDTIDSGFCVFRMLFDETDRPVDYRFLEVNPAFERQTGLVDPVGRTARELVPELEDRWFELYGEIATTGRPNRITMGAVAMGRVFEVYGFRLGGEESRDVALLFTDVTAQKTIESTLRDANARVTDILGSISDGFFAIDAEWRFTYVNAEAERLLRLTSDELVGRVLWDVYEGLDESGFGALYRRVVAERTAASLTAYYPDHDRWYEAQAFPASEGFTVYFRDVTEQRRGEEERERLLREIDRERSMLELAHADSFAFVAILSGPDLVFEYANPPYFQLVGHRDIVGKPLAEALPEVMDQGFPELLRGVMATGESFHTSEIPVKLQRIPDAPLEDRIVSLRYLPVREADGTISGVYAHGIDVTEMVNSRRILAARAEETALGSRRKDEFLATLAHELRNPLAPIRLSTEMMDFLDPEDPEFAEARTVIRRQVDHMVRLVDDLLDVSRVAQGKIKLRCETVDLADVVAAAVETSRPLVESGAHALAVEGPPAPVHVDGDPTRLAQVLANLLNNAAKYTPRGGRIALSFGREGGQAFLRVRDSGVGISEEMLPHVFDMFAQAEVQLSQSQGGLGIGLTLSRRLVEMHGGTIEAASEGQGRGSEFVVRLPAVEGSPAAEEVATETAAGAGRRVLVVDDNADNAWTLAGLLRSMRHEVRVAHTGREAIEAADAFLPDVVLLDLGLPDIPGYEVARRLRADARFDRATIVAQTGWGREEDRALSREAGFDDHLVKPLSRPDLDRVFAGIP